MRSTILMAVFSTALFSAGSLLREAPAKAGRKVNPFSGDAAAIRAGEKLYQRECASCHGLSGEGAGKRPPLAAGLVTGSSPGAIEWVIRTGASRRGMPSFSHLPEQQRWQIITYLQRPGA